MSNNVIELPNELNYSINDLLKNMTNKDKKLLLISLLNEKKEIYFYNENNNLIFSIKDSLNFIINLILIEYNNLLYKYPLNINILHFILFNNLNMNILLYILINLYYEDKLIFDIHLDNNDNPIKNLNCYYSKLYNISLYDYLQNNKPCIILKNKLNQHILFLINELYNSLNLNIIEDNNFNHDYDKLFLNNN